MIFFSSFKYIAQAICALGSSGKPYCLEAKSYSSSSSLPGFYAAYPPTPPKDSSSTDADLPRPSDDYLQPAGLVQAAGGASSNNDDILGGGGGGLGSELKPNPEALMSFPSFPYTSRKIQEGIVAAEGLSAAAAAAADSSGAVVAASVASYPEPCSSPSVPYSYYLPPTDGVEGSGAGSPLYYGQPGGVASPFNPKGGLPSPRQQRAKIRTNAGKWTACTRTASTSQVHICNCLNSLNFA